MYTDERNSCVQRIVVLSMAWPLSLISCVKLRCVFACLETYFCFQMGYRFVLSLVELGEREKEEYRRIIMSSKQTNRKRQRTSVKSWRMQCLGPFLPCSENKYGWLCSTFSGYTVREWVIIYPQRICIYVSVGSTVGPVLEHHQKRDSVVNSARYSELLIDRLKPPIWSEHRKALFDSCQCPFTLLPKLLKPFRNSSLKYWLTHHLVPFQTIKFDLPGTEDWRNGVMRSSLLSPRIKNLALLFPAVPSGSIVMKQRWDYLKVRYALEMVRGSIIRNRCKPELSADDLLPLVVNFEQSQGKYGYGCTSEFYGIFRIASVAPFCFSKWFSSLAADHSSPHHPHPNPSFPFCRLPFDSLSL